MSIIAAGTTTTTALSSTGNTDGTLQLQVNGTTPSVTLNALGAVGVGAVPNFGTSGQALVSSGSTAAPTWANVTTSPAGTTGQVQINNAGAFGAVSSGTTGQVLTSQGTGAAPVFATPSIGAMTLIATANPSGASTVEFTGLSTAYMYYVLAAKNIIVSNVNSALRIQCSKDNGATFVITNNYQINGASYAVGVGNLTQTTSNFPLISSLRTDYPASVYAQLFVNASGSYFGLISTAQGSYSTADTYVNGRTLVGQLTDDTSPVNAVRVQISSGTFSGIVRLYGVTA